jgi:hypothetical protein
VRVSDTFGLVIGVTRGAASGAAALLVDARAASSSQLGLPDLLSFGIGLLGPLLAGAAGSRRTSSVAGGVVAGFWCGLGGTLMYVVLSIAALQIFANRLEAGPWLGDPYLAHMVGCANATGARLGACQSGDEIGGLAIRLLASPVIGAALGALGAVAAWLPAGSLAVERTFPLRPLALVAALGILFTFIVGVELIANLW